MEPAIPHSFPAEIPTFPSPPPIQQHEIETFPNDKLASYGGHGTLEILKVTQILEENSIPCCLAGTSALIYYGANRGRGDWHICVPTVQLDAVSSLLKSDPYTNDYISVRPFPIPQPGSLVHTFPRFKCNGVDLYFIIAPSKDCHFKCEPSNFQRSSNGLPYPKLDVFVQSLLDTHDMVALCDVVDGTNVSEEWGNEHLDLIGTNDMEWVEWKNNIINAQKDTCKLFCQVGTAVHSLRETWEETVRGKEKRMGWKHHKELFATRFRLHSMEDPWLNERDCA